MIITNNPPVPGDKAKTAKEEARELLLKEEASVRAKVGQVQKNLALMLDALGELSIANPIFTHGQLPSLVSILILSFPSFLFPNLLLGRSCLPEHHHSMKDTLIVKLILNF
jgi:hypothetical protein